MAELSPTFNEVLPILGECSIDILYMRGTATWSFHIFFTSKIFYIAIRAETKFNLLFSFCLFFFFFICNAIDEKRNFVPYIFASRTKNKVLRVDRR